MMLVAREGAELTVRQVEEIKEVELRSRRAQFINAVIHLADFPVKKLGTDRLLGEGGSWAVGVAGAFRKVWCIKTLSPPK